MIKPFEVYKEIKHVKLAENCAFYRWRVTHPNGNILAVSSESYSRRVDCVQSAIATFKILKGQFKDDEKIKP